MMNKFLIISILSFLSFQLAFAQSEYPAMLKKKQFSKLEKKVDKTLRKNPTDIEANFYKASLYVAKGYEEVNPDTAYKYVMIAGAEFATVSDKEELKVLRKKKITKSFISRIAKKSISLAFSNAQEANTIEAYEGFLMSYPEATLDDRQRALDKIELIHLKEIKDSNSVDAYREFIATHPKSEATTKAMQRMSFLAFREAAYLNTKGAYKRFTEEYPDSKEFSEANARYKEMQYLMADNEGCWCVYSSVLQSNASKEEKDAAQDSLLARAKRTKDLGILKYGVNNFTGLYRNRAFMLMHDIYTNDGEMVTYNQFYKGNEDPLFESLRFKDFRLAALGDSLELSKGYKESMFKMYDRYIREAAPNERAFVALQKYIASDIAAKRWDAALAKFDRYAEFFGNENKHINDLRQLLEAKEDKTINIQSIGKGVNTVSGGEYVPVITADGKSMYFCGKSRLDSIGGEDVYVANYVDNHWGNVEIIKDLSFPRTNDSPLSISADGTKLLLFVTGKLNISAKTRQGWALPKPLPRVINSERWQADAMITSDGNALLFASVRQDGYNHTGKVPYHGAHHYASDIYVSVQDENGAWGTPINLGNVINTEYCDRMPFLHPDMKTLYFSSDGHGGLGGLDVFKSTRLADSCWNCWSEPINLGKEVNTESNDWGYKISTDGETAYFAKGARGESSQDIYTLNLPVSMRPNLVATISGKIVDEVGNIVEAEIVWEDLVTGQIIGRSKSDPKDGSYFIVLPLDKMYGYYVVKDGYFPLSDNVDLRKQTESLDVNKDMHLVSFFDMVDKGVAVPITNLFFNTNESEILPYSIPELKRVARILKEQHLKVEISGHTDNVGDADKNITLSEYRALEVKLFLVKEGLDETMLSTKGYGATKPIADNSTVIGRAKNRRVEMRIVK